jgi:hypothetical protein
VELRERDPAAVEVHESMHQRRQTEPEAASFSGHPERNDDDAGLGHGRGL